MKRLYAVIITLFAALAVATPALAFGWSDIKSVLTGDTWPLILTGVVFLAFLVAGNIIMKVIKTLREVGELLIHFSDMVTDKKVTREEIDQFKADIRDVVNIWRKTPEEYLPDAPVEPPAVN